MSRCKRPRLSSSGRESRIKTRVNVRRRKGVKEADEAIGSFMQAIEDAEAQEALKAIDEDREPREMFICPNCGEIDFNAIQEKARIKGKVGRVSPIAL